MILGIIGILSARNFMSRTILKLIACPNQQIRLGVSIKQYSLNYVSIKKILVNLWRRTLKETKA